MSREIITFSCGHEDTIVLFGNSRERARKAKWLAERKCSCYEAELAAQRASESAEATEKAKASGLPILQGSPKQIAWAESIRAKALASEGNNPLNKPDDEDAKQDAQRNGWSFEDVKIAHKAILDAEQAARGELLKQSDAKWWIDHNHLVATYVRDAAQKTATHYWWMLNTAKKARDSQ